MELRTEYRPEPTLAPERVRESARLRWAHVVLVAVVAFSLLLAGFIGGVASMWFNGDEMRAMLEPASATTDEELAERERRMRMFFQVWDLLESEYLDPAALTLDRLVYGATAGLVAAVGDPHTLFLEPVPSSIIDADLQGSFDGIGATVDQIDGRVTIVEPLEGSPAKRAGLLPGDVIIAIDGVDIEGEPLLEAIERIRGPRGTTVRLTIVRAGVDEPFTVDVTRDVVELPNIEARLLEGGVAYLRLNEFNALSDTQVRAALRELLESDPRGLVLDLRGNPGGFLDMSVEVASEFLPQGTLLLVEKQRGVDDHEYRVERSGIATEVPLVVLVDGGSASASEIVAGAIQAHGRGVLIGQRTYGKGSVQKTYGLEDGSSLRVTVARWYLPGGRNLDGEGLTPEIEQGYTAEDQAAGRDPQLERATAYILNGE